MGIQLRDIVRDWIENSLQEEQSLFCDSDSPFLHLHLKPLSHRDQSGAPSWGRVCLPQYGCFTLLVFVPVFICCHPKTIFTKNGTRYWIKIACMQGGCHFMVLCWFFWKHFLQLHRNLIHWVRGKGADPNCAALTEGLFWFYIDMIRQRFQAHLTDVGFWEYEDWAVIK